MGIQDLKLPFMRKTDLEKRKEEMKYAIGLFGRQKKLEEASESEKLQMLAKEVAKLNEETMPRAESEKAFSDFEEEVEDIKVPVKPQKEIEKPKLVEAESLKAKQQNVEKQTEPANIKPAEDIFKKQLPTFYFWYCELKASTLGEFEDAIKKAPLQSIEHHSSNHDFSKWLKGNMQDDFVASLNEAELKKGEALRAAILDAISALKKQPKSAVLIASQNNDKKRFKEPFMASI